MKLEEMWEDWKGAWECLLHVLIIISPFCIVGALIGCLIKWIT